MSVPLNFGDYWECLRIGEACVGLGVPACTEYFVPLVMTDTVATPETGEKTAKRPREALDQALETVHGRNDKKAKAASDGLVFEAIMPSATKTERLSLQKAMIKDSAEYFEYRSSAE